MLKTCVENGGYEGTPLPEDLFELDDVETKVDAVAGVQ